MMIIRVSMLVISVGLLVIGSLTDNKSLEIAGAVFFLLFELVDLFVEYKEAKLYHADKWKPNEKPSIPVIFLHFLRQGMFFMALLLTILGHTSGMIIFVGIIISYILSGWIAQNVAGIPLEMGYGGWHKPNFRRRHR